MSVKKLCRDEQYSAKLWNPSAAHTPLLSPVVLRWEAPGEAAWKSRLLVGKWHLQLNAAGLPCQCALVKYVQCHPVCRLFVIQIKAEKLHISVSRSRVSAAIQAVNSANWPYWVHLSRCQNTCSTGFAPNDRLHKTTVNNVPAQPSLPSLCCDCSIGNRTDPTTSGCRSREVKQVNSKSLWRKHLLPIILWLVLSTKANRHNKAVERKLYKPSPQS